MKYAYQKDDICLTATVQYLTSNATTRRILDLYWAQTWHNGIGVHWHHSVGYILREFDLTKRELTDLIKRSGCAIYPDIRCQDGCGTALSLKTRSAVIRHLGTISGRVHLAQSWVCEDCRRKHPPEPAPLGFYINVMVFGNEGQAHE